jgi:hypothetical protein
MNGVKNISRILVGKYQGKRPLPMRKWDDDIKDLFITTWSVKRRPPDAVDSWE